jgi:DNA-binding response OmpR family regulator
MKPKILVIDDDADLQRLVQVALERRGYQVLSASDGLQGLRFLYEDRPDLVVLDVMMSNMDGWEALGRIRELSSVPVIMLTALGETADLVRGLNQGADDYVVKPFQMEELVARIEALLRRSQEAAEDGSYLLSIDDGNLLIDTRSRRVTVRGNEVRLTPTEYRLLVYLAQNAGRVMTYENILASVWDVTYEGGDKNVKVFVTYLRRKIEQDPKNPRYIQSEWGIGYFMPKL